MLEVVVKEEAQPKSCAFFCLYPGAVHENQARNPPTTSPAQEHQAHRRILRSRFPGESHRPGILRLQTLGRQPSLRLRRRLLPRPHARVFLPRAGQVHRDHPRPRLRSPRHLHRRQRPRRLHPRRHRFPRRPRRPPRHLVHPPRRSLHARPHAPLLPRRRPTPPLRTIPRSLAPPPPPPKTSPPPSARSLVALPGRVAHSISVLARVGLFDLPNSVIPTGTDHRE